MSADREWFAVGAVEFSNLEEARLYAEGHASQTDRAVDIYRYTRVRVACLKREITVKEMDVSQVPPEV
ncbi:hypothetical protein [Streptomyces formicae]|uniref:DUF1330 domain-containing protein n=1 Tax=Streptomyces formicae TaxID=1616117 RepID=A0ABY3WIA6_9ACTN|nr:hypothetical protein [Streptomyces formicae]UNM12313.1 hypothetical protein J4032_12910 [Streptomyces formicae]